MENQTAYCKTKRKFFTPKEIAGITKCPYCGENLHKNIGNLHHTINNIEK